MFNNTDIAMLQAKGYAASNKAAYKEVTEHGPSYTCEVYDDYSWKIQMGYCHIVGQSDNVASATTDVEAAALEEMHSCALGLPCPL